MNWHWQYGDEIFYKNYKNKQGKDNTITSEIYANTLTNKS